MDAGLVHFQQMPGLEELELNSKRITDGGVKTLGTLRWLKTLNVRMTNISDAGAWQLQYALPHTQVIHPATMARN